MKWRFQWVWRLGLVAFAAIAFWAVWSEAQTVTNIPAKPAGITTPASDPTTPTNKIPVLTFGLDTVDFLKEHEALNQPLWKYLASLIYIALAFLAAWVLDQGRSRWWPLSFF